MAALKLSGESNKHAEGGQSLGGTGQDLEGRKPEDNPPPDSDEWPRLQQLSMLIESKIGYHHNLINYRMTWLVTSQSFLFLAWASIPNSLFMDTQKRLLFSVIWIVGFISAAVAWRATKAAIAVLQILLASRETIEGLMRVRLPRAFSEPKSSVLPEMGPGRAAVSEGHLPARILPSLFLGGWTAIGGQGVALHFYQRQDLFSPDLFRWVPFIVGMVVSLTLILTGRHHGTPQT